MFRNSWQVGALAGVDLKIHITFPLVVALGAFQWGTAHGAAGALFGALLTLALFGCVALHELGHALAARRFGIATREAAGGFLGLVSTADLAEALAIASAIGAARADEPFSSPGRAA